ncbi:MAG TPA: TonB-dependent receptor [Allosphingosinicella sp.]
MRTVLLTTAAFAALLPGAAYAQGQSAPAPQSDAGGVQATAAPVTEEEGLNTVTITAQRRSENLQRAAVAVDVVQGQELIEAGVSNVSRLSELAPALSIQPTSTGPIIFMRGVGNFTVVSNSDPAIAFNYDGIYLGRVPSANGAFYDLQRVEVLKGPQGTLYGRNATGGAINVIPAHPELGELSGYGSVSYGNYNALTAEGAVNIPFGDTGAFRVSGAITDHDGYLDDGLSDGISQALRVQLLFHPTDRLTIRVSGDYDHDGGGGNSISYLGNYVFVPAQGRYVFNPSNVPIREGVYTPASQAYRQTVSVQPTRRRLDALTPFPAQDNDFFGTHAEITWDAGFGTFTLIPAWRRSELDTLSDAGGFMFHNFEDADQTSVELRLAGNRVGIFDYTLGLYYFDETIDNHTALSISSAFNLFDQRLTTESWAPFARITAHLTEQLRLVGGIRYTHDSKSFAFSGTGGTLICVLPQPTQCNASPLFPLVERLSDIPFFFPAAPGAPQPLPGAPGTLIQRTAALISSRLSSSRVTFRGAVEYDVAPRSLLYASVETGYRSGGFSAAAGFETYNPEFITAYTIGLKNRFFDNRLQLNLEAFLWDYRDQQVNHVGLDLNGRTANFTENIGSSRIYGVEVEARALVTTTTLISVDVQYLHARNRSFIFTTGVASGPPLTGCPFAVSATNPAVYNVDCSGFDSYNSPHWTANLAIQQTIPLDRYQIVLGADTQYKSSRDVGFAYLAEQHLGSVWRSNAQIQFGRADDTWSLAFYVRNIENNRTPQFMSLHPTASILIAGTTPPLLYGVRASFAF